MQCVWQWKISPLGVYPKNGSFYQQGIIEKKSYKDIFCHLENAGSAQTWKIRNAQNQNLQTWETRESGQKNINSHQIEIETGGWNGQAWRGRLETCDGHTITPP
jgi:hypothetical protein